MFSVLVFYRAMHFSAKRGLAIACRPSVCLSVCLSVTLVISLWLPLLRDWGFATYLLSLISGTGKVTDFTFGGYIYRANPNKSPL